MRIENGVTQGLRPPLAGADMHVRPSPRLAFQRFGVSVSMLIGLIGVTGFVISGLLAVLHALRISTASWWMVLSLAVYGFALGLGRLHETLSRDASRHGRIENVGSSGGRGDPGVGGGEE